MFNDLTDFTDSNWNGWVSEVEDAQLRIITTEGNPCLEYPRQPSTTTPRHLLHKPISGLEVGKRYAFALRVRRREDHGTGAQSLTLALDNEPLLQKKVEGEGWQTLIGVFSAQAQAHTVSITYLHTPNHDLRGGDFQLDDLELLRVGDGSEVVDLTNFEDDDAPWNDWTFGSNGVGLRRIALSTGGYVAGYDAPAGNILGEVLRKDFTLEPGQRYSFSAKYRKAGFDLGKAATLRFGYDGNESEVHDIASLSWRLATWQFVASTERRISINVRERLEPEPAGLLIDDLLVTELFDDVTDFSGRDLETQLNGWVLHEATSDRVSVLFDSQAEGNVLNFPTGGGFKHDGIVLSRQYPGLLPGATYEFQMRVRSINDIDNARLSVAFGTHSVMGETIIANRQWPPKDESLYRGTFTVGAAEVGAPLTISNHNPESVGNDYRFSELRCRRVDLDTE